MRNSTLSDFKEGDISEDFTHANFVTEHENEEGDHRGLPQISSLTSNAI